MNALAPLLANITKPLFVPPRFAPSLAPRSETIAAALNAEAPHVAQPSIHDGHDGHRYYRRRARKVRMARKRRRGF